jgi:hypothetical protein
MADEKKDRLEEKSQADKYEFRKNVLDNTFINLVVVMKRYSIHLNSCICACVYIQCMSIYIYFLFVYLGMCTFRS